MHDNQPLMREVDLRFPFEIPLDRRLTHGEQTILFLDIMPPILRRGDHPDERDREFDAFWENYRRVSTSVLTRYGWLLNRLDWDKEWQGEGYFVPECCQPGAKRWDRSKLARMRRAQQTVPPIKLSEASDFGEAPF